MTKRMEVLEFIRDHQAVTASEVSDCCHIDTWTAMDIINDLANEGFVGARYLKNTMGMVAWLKQTAAQRVMSHMEDKMASPTLEVSALTGLTVDETLHAIEYLKTQNKVFVKDDIVVLKRNTPTLAEVVGSFALLAFIAGCFFGKLWLIAAASLVGGACYFLSIRRNLR